MVEYDLIEHGGKKIALIGLLTTQPDLYQPYAFGGAIKTAKPILETALG